MIESVKDLHKGDMVRIVSNWVSGCGQARNGAMDHWLGQVMTVRCVCDKACFMEEDIGEYSGNIRRGWAWNKYCIAEVMPSDYLNETDRVSVDDYLSILNA